MDDARTLDGGEMRLSGPTAGDSAIPWSRASPTRAARASPDPPAGRAPEPLRRLTTVRLVDVYKRINRHYYETASASRRGAIGSDAGTARSAGGRSAHSVGSAGEPPGRASGSVEGSDRRRPRAFSHSHSPDADALSRRSGASSGSAARTAPRRPADPRDILHDRYVVGRVIGRGSFGRVAVGYDIVTDTRVALKAAARSDARRAQATREIETLKMLGGGGGEKGGADDRGGHPNVVRMLDAFVHRGEDVFFERETEAGRTAERRGTRAAEPRAAEPRAAASFRAGTAGENGENGENARSDSRAGADDPGAVDASDASEGHRASTSSRAAKIPGIRYIVFELLSHSLYDVLRATGFRGVSLGLLRRFSRQIFSALEYLRSHGVVHCDVKPENVLLCSTDRSAVKLIDFGSSCLVGETGESAYVQSRFYRAAEVLLGLPFGCEVDAWSLGCVMIELHGGKPAFPGVDERDQLEKIVEALGAPPAEMLDEGERRRARRGARAFPPDLLGRALGPPKDTNNGVASARAVALAAHRAFRAGKDGRERDERAAASRSRGGDGGEESAAAEAAARTLAAVRLGSERREGGESGSNRDRSLGEDDAEVEAFCDLIERVLTYSPEARATPGEALEHPFFTRDWGVAGSASSGGRARGGGAAGGGERARGGREEADAEDAGLDVDREMLAYGLHPTDAR